MYNAVARHLLLLSQGKTPLDPTEGVCYEIKEQFGPEVLDVVMAHIEKWTRHSGVDLFPIPCPDGYCPKLRYNNTKDLWAGRYGHNRKELCKFLAGELVK